MQRRTIAVAANFTAEPVAESLAFWLRGFGLPSDVEHAPFDQVFQELLDPSSLLGANRTGANVVLLRLDLWLETSGEGGVDRPPSSLRAKLEELASALREASGRAWVPHVVVLCPPDPTRLDDPAGAAELGHAERWLAGALAGTANLQLITSDLLVSVHGPADYFDADSDAIGRIPYTETLFATVGTLVARRVRAALAVPYKVVVLDCDNTLWRGVVGEAGPMGVEVDDALRALQELVVRQHEAGMLVCLCSKNNEADVQEVFRLRPEMPLAWRHVAGARINWLPKSENLRSLAAELDLGLSSFVFVDDSPFEVAEVRRNCPEVLALQLPSDADGIRRFADHAWFFDRTAVTATDRLRAASYAQNTQRNDVRKRAASLEEFLNDLELRVAIREPGPDDLERAAQMTQRTNQFNLSTVRRTTAEIGALLSSGSLQARIVDVRDRFGDYGVVGLLLFESRGATLRVDTFLLSCRALGRRVEHRMLAHLGELARARGATTIELPFVRSAKNTPVLRFLRAVTRDGAADAAEQVFVVTADAACAAPSLPVSDVDTKGADAAEADAAKQAAAEPEAPPIDVELVSRLYADLRDATRLVAALHSARASDRGSAERVLVSPRNEVEATLLAIWKDVLHDDRVGVTDDFFDLGGNSLAAVPMFARLRKRFHTALGPTALLEAPTIAQLAQRLTAPAQVQADLHTSLLPIQRGGSQRPLFLIHAGAGTIFIYHQLATALGPEQPVYGLQVQGLYSTHRPHWTIEEMAAHYAREIRSVQPSGPYRLGGFCLGATIALEVALQLERAGEEVSFLASFDGPAPGYRGGARRSSVAETASRRLWFRAGLKAAQMRNRLLLRYTNRRGAPVPLIFRRASWYFTVNNMLAKLRYAPSDTFDGRMHVFTIEGRYADPTIGWGQWCTGGAVSHEIAGEFRLHRDLMRPPMVHAVSARLGPLLNGSRPGTPAYSAPEQTATQPIGQD